MAADYWASTQHASWLFDREELADARKALGDAERPFIQQYPLPDQRHFNIFVNLPTGRHGSGLREAVLYQGRNPPDESISAAYDGILPRVRNDLGLVGHQRPLSNGSSTPACSARHRSDGGFHCSGLQAKPTPSYGSFRRIFGNRGPERRQFKHPFGPERDQDRCWDAGTGPEDCGLASQQRSGYRGSY
ncbi:conserved hypothetical protein [Uncinocarpus reesii 1704]|uniref:Uncharacterized protein n=1 Tax=Uncinocarpus reesii (strain UAMH 1704) TaxID=336963 RepID=C4JDQ0_UNCRE|nr:uncharacterized protein UREG_00368 [Uncinocarpus reesii 1704]EEP75522.1 conserved hypothetical protein [Uncinocarpus reesii 1704]